MDIKAKARALALRMGYLCPYDMEPHIDAALTAACDEGRREGIEAARRVVDSLVLEARLRTALDTSKALAALAEKRRE